MGITESLWVIRKLKSLGFLFKYLFKSVCFLFFQVESFPRLGEAFQSCGIVTVMLKEAACLQLAPLFSLSTC